MNRNIRFRVQGARTYKNPIPAMQSVPAAQTASDRMRIIKKPMGMRESGIEVRSQAVGFSAHSPVLKSRYSVYQFPGWYLLRDI